MTKGIKLGFAVAAVCYALGIGAAMGRCYQEDIKGPEVVMELKVSHEQSIVNCVRANYDSPRECSFVDYDHR